MLCLCPSVSVHPWPFRHTYVVFQFQFRLPAVVWGAGAAQVLAIDRHKYTMRVGAGMRYTEFLKAAEEAGMSVQVRRNKTCDFGE